MSPRVLFEVFGVAITETAVVGLLLSAVMAAIAAVVGARLRPRPGGAQSALEAVLGFLRDEVAGVVGKDNADGVFPFVATLALWIALANTLSLIPLVPAPTSDISVTAALAAVVFLSVPWFGIRRHGLGGYLMGYLRPTPLMLPFNVIGELSRTLALAVRLFGNIVSGNLMVAVALAIAGVLVPIPLMALSLLQGVLHAYIFAILALVYIGAAIEVHRPEPDRAQKGT